MGCGCRSRIYGDIPKKKSNCLCINDLRIGCNKGPSPCGGQMTIDLTEYNDVSASNCPVVYILKSYDTKAFSEVTLTDDGTLHITTSATFKKSQEFKITYKVSSPCSILSDEATVYVCMRDLCVDVYCVDGKCDQCDGGCEPYVPEININDLIKKEIKLI